MGAELIGIEDGLRHLLRLHIGQFPLPGGLRDLPTDIAVDRVAREHDLGAALILDDLIENTRIVVVEIAEAAQSILLSPDRRQQLFGVFVPRGLINAKDRLAFGIPHEERIKRLPMTGDPGKGVQVRL